MGEPADASRCRASWYAWAMTLEIVPIRIAVEGSISAFPVF
jgi:hypothetical protein